MAKPAHRLRFIAGASLLALTVGMPAARAQTGSETAANGRTASEVLSDLRQEVSGATSPAAAAEDEGVIGGPEEAGEPDPAVLKDGDIPLAQDQPLADREPADPDAEPTIDGDLSADGEANVIVEAPEEAADPEAGAEPEPGEAEPADLALPAEAAVTGPGLNEDGGGAPSVEPTLRPAYEEENPYEPLGIRAGSLIFYPSVTLEQRFDDNVLRTRTGQISDRALAIRPSLRIASDWSRHSMEADISGVRSHYQKLDSEDERSFDANLRGRIDVTSNTLIEGMLGYQLSQESRGTIDFPAGIADRPDVTDMSASLALTQRFNRLVFRLRGALADSDRSGDGLDASEDFLETSLGLRVGYEVSPGFYVFAEHERFRRTYAAPSAADGLLRDADGHVTRAGIAAEIAAKLTGELAAGTLVEDPDADPLASIEGLIADGKLTWTPSALTTINLGFRSSISPTSIAGSAGALERAADFDIRHEFRRWLAAVGGLGYTARNYAGTDLEEDTLRARFGLEYLIGRAWVLGAEYQRTELWSSEPDLDYSDNLFRITGTLRQ